MRYDYDIFHTPGKDMFLADSLSRPCEPRVCNVSVKRSDSLERLVDEYVSNMGLREEELLTALESDIASQQCIDFIKHGWPRSSHYFNGEIANLYHNRAKLTMCNDFIMFGSRFYIPESLRSLYLQRVHEGHQGVNKCQERARNLFWWPGVNESISLYIHECENCIKNSRVLHEPWTESPIPKGPWCEIGVDIFEFKNELFVIMIDYYSKWIEVERVPSQTAEIVCDALRKVFADKGTPTIVRSDNGPCFASATFRLFADSVGFKHVTSSPRYPQSNGLVERGVGIVKNLWRKSNDREAALLAYRVTPLKYTEYSPGDLMYGRSIRSPLSVCDPDTKVDYSEYEKSLIEYRNKIKLKWDRNHRAHNLSDLEEGQLVWVKTPNEKGFEGSVERRDTNPNSCWIKKGISSVRRNRKHLFPFVRSRYRKDSDGSVPPLVLYNSKTPPTSDGEDIVFHNEFDSDVRDDYVNSDNGEHNYADLSDNVDSCRRNTDFPILRGLLSESNDIVVSRDLSSPDNSDIEPINDSCDVHTDNSNTASTSATDSYVTNRGRKVKDNRKPDFVYAK
jgi:transposase InsO family protein